MSRRGIGNWIGVCVVLLVGAGFLVASIAGTADADTFRRAQACGDRGAAQDDCYTLQDGTIASVDVRHSRSGEHDDVVITVAGGSLNTTLEPSTSTAQAIRTGAAVQAKLYRGKVATVFVGGYGIPSDVNPAANQAQLRSYGLLFLLLGGVYLAAQLYPLYKRRTRAAGELAATLAGTGPAGDQAGRWALQQTLLPGGRVGTEARPRLRPPVMTRLAVVPLALLFLTFRAFFIPGIANLAWGFDAVVVLLGGAVLWLYFRRVRLSADADGLARVDLLGRVRRYPLSSISRAERFSIKGRYGSNPVISFVGVSGTQLFRLGLVYWDRDEVEALVGGAGIRLAGAYDDEVSAYQLNSKVPGSTNWGLQAAIGVGLVAVITLVVVVLSGPGHR